MLKNILLIISGGVIIYLLKNKQTKNEDVVLSSNANLLQEKEGGVVKSFLEYKYRTCIYSDEGIKANLIKKGDRVSTVNLQGIVATDGIKISGIPVVY
jgi:hypothetical protein